MLKLRGQKGAAERRSDWQASFEAFFLSLSSQQAPLALPLLLTALRECAFACYKTQVAKAEQNPHISSADGPSGRKDEREKLILFTLPLPLASSPPLPLFLSPAASAELRSKTLFRCRRCSAPHFSSKKTTGQHKRLPRGHFFVPFSLSLSPLFQSLPLLYSLSLSLSLSSASSSRGAHSPLLHRCAAQAAHCALRAKKGARFPRPFSFSRDAIAAGRCGAVRACRVRRRPCLGCPSHLRCRRLRPRRPL